MQSGNTRIVYDIAHDKELLMSIQYSLARLSLTCEHTVLTAGHCSAIQWARKAQVLKDVS